MTKCFDADRFDGLSGTFYDFRYHNPDDENPPRGDDVHLSYGDKGNNGKLDEDYIWFEHNMTGGSDYNGGLLTRSNYEVLRKEAERLDQDPSEVPDDCRPFYVLLSGGYNTYAIVFHAERTPDAIVDMLSSLEDYPILDDDHHSRLEMEAEDEAWKSWVENDYRRALAKEAERVFGYEVEMDDVTDDDLFEHFRENMDGANENWIHEESGPYIHLDRIAKYALSSGDEDDLPKGAKTLRRQFKSREAYEQDDSFDGVKRGGSLMDLPSFRKRR